MCRLEVIKFNALCISQKFDKISVVNQLCTLVGPSLINYTWVGRFHRGEGTGGGGGGGGLHKAPLLPWFLRHSIVSNQVCTNVAVLYLCQRCPNKIDINLVV